MLNQSLRGFRVLDFSWLFPGPLCTLMLADLGADVIKIEPPEGEPARFYPPFQSGAGATFLQLNRGKRSLSLNLKKPDASEIVHRLLKGADVLVESFRPGVMEKFGLDYESIKEQYPRVVYCSITGYGQEGMRAQQPGHDLNYISLAGIVGLSGQEKALVIPPVQIADLLGGFQAGMAILAALIHRSREQQGQYISISLLNGAFFALISLAGMHFAGVPLRENTNPLSGRLACYHLYRTQDDRYLALALLEPKFWNPFCEKMRLPEFSGNPLLLDQEKVISILNERIAAFPLQHWLDLFAGDHLCISPVNNFEEALAQFTSTMLFNLPYQGGTVPHVKTPFITKSAAESPAPAVGEQNVEILTEIGYSFPEIESLKIRSIL